MNTQTTTPQRAGKLLALASAIPFVALPFSAQAQSASEHIYVEVSFDEVSAGLDHGTLFSGDEYASSGVTFSVDSNGQHNQLLIFDTDVSSTRDTDLENPFIGGNLQGITGLGNALIIAENVIDRNGDGLVDNPDDEARGGTIGVVFANEQVTDVGFNLYDTPENSRSDVSIVFKDSSGAEVIWRADDLIANGSNVEFGNHYGNSFTDITAASLGLTNIKSIDFNIESGAVDHLHFCAVVPEPSSVALLGLGALGMLFRRKRA
ncbi:PEP-CTERM sorting domain-containing protein [Verrucomicrobiaceae bacterium R5-34]|nr:PEP-CTERM sorting domain-containing protein [Verrucomicrobiaceae bacterium R5-34]